MTPVDVSSALAAEHIRDLQTSAARHRLAALVRCCRPSAWQHATRAVGGFVTGRRFS